MEQLRERMVVLFMTAGCGEIEAKQYADAAMELFQNHLELHFPAGGIAFGEVNE